MSESSGSSDNVWLAVSGEDSMQIVGLRRWPKGKHVIKFLALNLVEMRFGPHTNSHSHLKN